MIYIPPDGQPAQVAPSDLDRAQARRIRRLRRRPADPAEAQQRARAHVDHSPTYRHPDDYLADTGVVYERGDAEGC